jgi:hypothetical protein
MNKGWELGFFAGVVVVGICLFSLPGSLLAQTPICSSTQGYNAVFGTCNNQIGVVGSAALIDASAWCNRDCTPHDLCDMISHAFASVPSSGGVIDARASGVRPARPKAAQGGRKLPPVNGA